MASVTPAATPGNKPKVSVLTKFNHWGKHFLEKLQQNKICIDGLPLIIKDTMSDNAGSFSKIIIVIWGEKQLLLKFHTNFAKRKHLDQSCIVSEERLGGEALALFLSKEQSKCTHIIFPTGAFIVNLKDKEFKCEYCTDLPEKGTYTYVGVSVFPYYEGSKDLVDFWTENVSNWKQENCIRQVEEITEAVLRAIAFLHQNGIAHRDIKPGNILINPEGVKVIDFGMAKVMGNTRRRHSFCGTRDYAPIELIKQLQYNATCDIWSLAAIIHKLLMGAPPLRGWNEKNGKLELAEKIKWPAQERWARIVYVRDWFWRHELGTFEKGWKAYFEANPVVEKKMKRDAQFLKDHPMIAEVFNRCLCLDPSGRPSAEEALALPFFAEVKMADS